MMTIKSQRFHRPPSIVPPNPRSASDWHLLILVILVIGTEQTPLQSASVHQWPSCGASQMSYRKEKYGKLIERRIQIKTFCLLSGGPLNVSFTAAENDMSTSLMRPSEFIEIQSVLICTVRPDAAGKIFLFLPGGSRQSGLSLGCGKERLPPPAIHYLKCVCCRQWAPNIQMHDGKDCCKQRFKREALTGHY